jgi:hypothetical protein
MTTPVTRISDTRIEIFDADGQLIGTISRPLDTEALGPGREKVYLARRPQPRAGRPSRDQAA